MIAPVLEVLASGAHASLQDAGRRGWRRFGVPPGGALDAQSRQLVNRLLGNPEDTPVLELLPAGARLRVLRPAAFALGGADGGALPRWRVLELRPGDEITWPRPGRSTWGYVGVRGGFVGRRWWGSVSPLPASGAGRLLRAGDVLEVEPVPVPSAVAGRWLARDAWPDETIPPRLRVWPGPQWGAFPVTEREKFFAAEWRVSARRSRAGYRLEGPALAAPAGIVSEPVLVGSIQVPPGGQPIVTLNDGPTVGGYVKLGLIEPDDLPGLVQLAAGGRVHFVFTGS